MIKLKCPHCTWIRRDTDTAAHEFAIRRQFHWHMVVAHSAVTEPECLSAAELAE